MLKLDFTIETSEAREKFIENYIAENGPSFTTTELETMANYILYGKDSTTGTSIVDRKEVEIDTKYSTYKKKKPESLDELIESPTFDENIIQDPTVQNHYKAVKPKIDREKDSYIPGIKELWAQIDYWDYLIKVSEGKINDPNIKKLSPLNLYKARHFLVELRRQQFYLKDAVCPTVLMFKTNVRPSYVKADTDIPWDFEDSDFAIAPLGILSSNPKRFWSPRDIEEKDYLYNTNAKYVIDFRNNEHIYYLFEAYEDLRCASDNKPESTLGGILDTLDFYAEKANLSDIKKEILMLKKKKIQNESIKSRVNSKFGTTYSANYISTIWKQKICDEVAEAARLHYDYYINRNNTFAWKKCNQCGELKLKDTREFMRKSRSSDGFANRCKMCDKENRKRG